jgi:pimeloyl-ACP methyl ester carboxylesterase
MDCQPLVPVLERGTVPEVRVGTSRCSRKNDAEIPAKTGQPLGIERAVLAGHSGSCLVVRRVALDHPDRVAGLVLEASPTTLRGDAGLQELMQSVVSSLADPISREVVRSFLINASSEPPRPTPAFGNVL